MSKEFIGNVTAYIPPTKPGEKGRSKIIGAAYKSNDGQISLVIDTLPIPQSGWQGWCNIQQATTSTPAPKKPLEFEDDIPF